MSIATAFAESRELLRSALSGSYRRLNRLFDRNSTLVSGLQLLPGLFWVFFFLGFAIAIVFVYSFLSEAPPTGAVSFTLQNYAELFSTELYRSIYRSSMVIAVGTTVSTLLLAYPPAYYLAFSDTERKTLLVILIILPFWINIVIRTYAWRLILGQSGILNYVLVSVTHLRETPLKLLNTKLAIVLGLVHILLPYMLVPLYSSLNTIDRADIEAAKTLGANRVDAFYEVTLPQSLPGISAGVVLVFVLAYGAFLIPMLLGGSQNFMIANIISTMFRSINDWPLGSAMSVVFLLVILVIVYVFNRLVGLSELYGGV